jgi:hypothetical protein
MNNYTNTLKGLFAVLISTIDADRRMEAYELFQALTDFLPLNNVSDETRQIMVKGLAEISHSYYTFQEADYRSWIEDLVEDFARDDWERKTAFGGHQLD